MILIDFQNITIQRGNHIILKNISFQIISNQITAIIGDNGCGKTSLLKTMIGLQNYQDGLVWRDFFNIGYVEQDYNKNIPDLMSANTFLNLFNYYHKDISKIIELLQIENILHIPITHLSTGQKKKIWIAQALLNKPSLLVIDEPFANLDLSSRQNIFELIHKIKSLGSSVIITGHVIHEIYKSFDQILHIKDNSIYSCDFDKCKDDQFI
jgi:ABC-type Mn2+/Zn2+ transport system ATPase subunit